jgi:hypothetical protein
MSVWRRKALETLPSERTLIEAAQNPMALWIELYCIFKRAVKDNDKNKTRKILNYASWCISEKSGKMPNDTSTAAICAFYEDIASHKEFWPQFNEWFFPDEFEKLKDCFSYHLSENEFLELSKLFYEKK